MKVIVGTVTQESFFKAFILKTEEGLEFRSPSMLWATKPEREKITKKFRTFLSDLKSIGVEVVGEELIGEPEVNPARAKPVARRA